MIQFNPYNHVPYTYGYPLYSAQAQALQNLQRMAPQPPQQPSGSTIPGVPPAQPVVPTPPGQLPIEESFIENILRLNLGKHVTIYMTFENNTQWNAKIFKGRLEAAGRDHIIISDPKTGIRYLLLMVNLDYVTFDEELNYTYPFAGPPSGTGR
jgi:spore germination protein Q